MDHHRVVLLLVGSFNPPHRHHINLLLRAKRTFESLASRGGSEKSEVELVMSPVNDGYGKAGLVAAPHRVAMCRLVATGFPIRVDDWEATQSSFVRTVMVRRHFLEAGAQRVLLVCGADLLGTLSNAAIWDQADSRELLAGGVLVDTRPGVDLAAMLAGDPLLAENYQNIHQLVSAGEESGHDLSMSSTRVRRMLEQGASVTREVGQGVADYIAKHGLYQGRQ